MACIWLKKQSASVTEIFNIPEMHVSLDLDDEKIIGFLYNLIKVCNNCLAENKLGYAANEFTWLKVFFWRKMPQEQ